MKSFEQLAEAAFLAFEKSVHKRIPARAEWQRLDPELKAHWIAAAKEVVSHYAAIH
jgi:hypothetical protein